MPAVLLLAASCEDEQQYCAEFLGPHVALDSMGETKRTTEVQDSLHCSRRIMLACLPLAHSQHVILSCWLSARVCGSASSLTLNVWKMVGVVAIALVGSCRC